MRMARKMAMGAIAAVALCGTGCAGFFQQLQAMQGRQNSPANAAATKARQEGIAATAAATQSATAIARQGDLYRDMTPRADYTAAHAAYREALQLEPRNTYVLVAQATAYLRQGSDEKFSNPDGSATSNADKLRQADKFFKRAKTLAEKALHVSPEYGTAHFVIAEVYALMGDFPKALEKLNAMEKNKQLPEGHTSTFYAWRGYVKKVTGDEAGAQADLEQAIEFAEPMEFGEYADRVLNPVQGPGANARPEFQPVVHAL